jgi:hypothetical protein
MADDPSKPAEYEYTVEIGPVRCSYHLASAQWNRHELFVSLLKSTLPPGYISRKEAEALADAIIAATRQDVGPSHDHEAGSILTKVPDRESEGQALTEASQTDE